MASMYNTLMALLTVNGGILLWQRRIADNCYQYFGHIQLHFSVVIDEDTISQKTCS